MSEQVHVLDRGLVGTAQSEGELVVQLVEVPQVESGGRTRTHSKATQCGYGRDRILGVRVLHFLEMYPHLVMVVEAGKADVAHATGLILLTFATVYAHVAKVYVHVYLH